MTTSSWSNGTDMLAALRAANPWVPTPLSFVTSRTIAIQDVTDDGEVVHVLSEVREPTSSYRTGMIVAVNDRATTLFLGTRDGRAGYLKVFTDDGAVSDSAPVPAWPTDGWEEFAIGLARFTLERRNSKRANPSGTRRVTAADHGPLQQFMASSGHRIGIESWQIAKDHPVAGIRGARVETWIEVTAVGPITYQRIAAAYDADGTIVGLAAVEAMPDKLEDTYFCVFAPDGNHRNLGAMSPNQDFFADSMAVLEPFLTPPPSSLQEPAAQDPEAPQTARNTDVLCLRHAFRSERGLVQPTNQDSVHAGPRLLAVASGISQPAGGEVASSLVIRALAPLDDGEPGGDVLGLLRTAVLDANAGIAAEVASRVELTGMATTLTAILFSGRHFCLAHLGDTRCYLLRDGQVSQITRDDTVVQALIEHNQITADQAADHPQRRLLTRTLTGKPVELPLIMHEARAGDRYLLCSRGLSGQVGIDRIYDTLRIREVSRSADRLVELALQAGGQENVTVVVADVVDSAAQ